MKRTKEVKVKVDFTEGYEERYTRVCLEELEQRKIRQQNDPVRNAGNQIDIKGIA